MKSRKIVVFGYNGETSIGRYVIEKAERLLWNILEIVDNDKRKQGEIINDKYIIKNPEVLKKLNEEDFLIIVSTDIEHDEIYTQLDNLGFKKKIDYDYVKNIPEIYSVNEYTFFRLYKNNDDLRPTILRIEISSYCNIHCEFCSFHSDIFKYKTAEYCNKNMPMSVAREIVTQINEIGTIRIVDNCMKGEMFCNPLWFEICQWIADNTEIEVFRFHTNGMLLSSLNINKLLKLRFKQIIVVVSIDGENSEEDEKLRSGSDYKIVKNNVYNLLNRKDNRFTIQFQNACFVMENSVQEEKFNYDILGGEWLKDEFFEDIKTLASPVLAGQVGANRADTEKFIELFRLKGIRKVKVPQKGMGCDKLFKEIAVNASGDVVFCACSNSYTSLGNIMVENMLNIWRGEILQNWRMKYANGESMEICQSVYCPVNQSKDAYFNIYIK